LAANRVQGVNYAVPATPHDLARELGDARAEDRGQAPVIERQELVDQQARDQQQLDAVGEAIGDEPYDAEMPIEEISDTEGGGERQGRPGSPAVSDPAFGPGAVDQGLGIS